MSLDLSLIDFTLEVPAPPTGGQLGGPWLTLSFHSKWTRQTDVHHGTKGAPDMGRPYAVSLG